VLRTTFLLLLLLILSTPVPAQQVQPVSLLNLKDLHGRTLRLEDYKGKTVLINFWATWCPPCRVEIPELIKLQREYWNRGLQVIGITYPPEKIGTVRRFVRRQRMNYPVALGTKATRALFDPDETLPITVIIDERGNVRGLVQGILYREEFDEKVKPLLH
jgi:cytochrome c biogenesis protein CcmG/thiol:disulfide interchange protein DsbE